MKTYLISYDLIRPETSLGYTNLINAIKSFGPWAKPLESLWLIKSDLTSLQIVNNLSKYTDNNDKLLVIEVTNDWTSLRLPDAVVKWMQWGL